MAYGLLGGMHHVTQYLEDREFLYFAVWGTLLQRQKSPAAKYIHSEDVSHLVWMPGTSSGLSCSKKIHAEDVLHPF